MSRRSFPGQGQLEATNESLQQLKSKAEVQVREAQRIELERELNRLNTEIGIATDQVRLLRRKSRARPAMPIRWGEARSPRRC